MGLEYRKFSEFQRGILFELLQDSYSYEPRYERDWCENWKETDSFFYDHLQIADECGFITVLNGVPIGFICWDPRNIPEYMEIGHNCIASAYKGNQYGKMQLQEAVRRMNQKRVKKIIVTTNEYLITAQKNYESVGLKRIRERENDCNPEVAGKLIDYEMIL